MMTELVTPEAAKMHLRIDDSDGDADLLLKIQGGSAALLSKCYRRGAVWW